MLQERSKTTEKVPAAEDAQLPILLRFGVKRRSEDGGMRKEEGGVGRTESDEVMVKKKIQIKK